MGKNKGKKNPEDKPPSQQPPGSQGQPQQRPQTAPPQQQQRPPAPASQQGSSQQQAGAQQPQSQQRPQTAQSQQQQRPPAPASQPGSSGAQQPADKRPPKGAWKDKQKQKPKEQIQQSGGQASQQQQQPARAIPVSQPPPVRQQQPQPMPVSVASASASQGSQRSDRSDRSKGAPPPKKQQSMDLAPRMEKLSMVEINYPTRESVTKTSKFKKERISTNYLNLNLQKLPDIVYHYDIKFVPDRPKKFMFPGFRTLIETYLPKQQNRVAYDGASSFYCMDKIPDADFASVSVASPDGCGNPKEFNISIKWAANVDMRVIKHYQSGYTSGTTLQQAIQALDIVLRTAFDRPNLIRFKRTVFATPTIRMFMQDNYEMYIGLFQSFVMGERPFLNVDVSHKAFPSEATSLITLYKQYQNFAEILNGLMLVYKSPFTQEKRTYKFLHVRGPANRETFPDDQDNNRMKSVYQYFKDKGCTLQHPELPCLHIGPPQRNVLIPMEFLSLPGGQALNRKAPESCTRDMVKIAATSTDVRKGKIMDLLRNVNYKSVETIRQFGMTVGENFIDVDSHILNPPALQYKENIVRIQRPGQWELPQKTNFIQPHTCTNWGMLVLHRSAQVNQLERFGDNIYKMATNMGLNFAPYNRNNLEKPQNTRLDQRMMDNLINQFKNKGIELLFVVISPFGDQYQDVKKSAELRCGMLTQCIKYGTIDRKGSDPSTLMNIVLKVNSKLGGSNQRIADTSMVSINNRPFMVIGADVTHPSPEQKNIPSVVGVAASYDKNAFRYNCQWRIQSPGDETIRDFDTIVAQHLNFFKNAHNRLPMHILYYRDGVSEGQFAVVKNIELAAMQKACQMVGGPDHGIKITCIVVQKRHHTRFFPKKPNPMDRKNNNVTPGTVVDSEIVDTNNKWQFFMVSHASIQGVAKPTKYCIIRDDASVTNEDLQVFTYNLCHLFTRCNRSVSYVAPTYYAHLVAARGRVYIHNERINFNNLEQENAKRQVKPEVISGRPMYFV